MGSECVLTPTREPSPIPQGWEPNTWDDPCDKCGRSAEWVQKDGVLIIGHLCRTHLKELIARGAQT